MSNKITRICQVLRRTCLPSTLAICCFGAAAVFSTVAVGDSGDVESIQTLEYRIVKSDIDVFLEKMSRDIGARLIISGRIPGQLVDMYIQGSFDDVLQNIAQHFELDVFYFNGAYNVSNKSDATTRLTRLGDIGFQDAKQGLSEAGLLLSGYPVKSVAGDKAIILSGPPKLLALSESVIESLVAKKPPPQKTIKVRRGTETTLVVID